MNLEQHINKLVSMGYTYILGKTATPAVRLTFRGYIYGHTTL